MIDSLGNEVNVGDTIVYAGRSWGYPSIRRGVILSTQTTRRVNRWGRGWVEDTFTVRVTRKDGSTYTKTLSIGVLNGRAILFAKAGVCES